MSYFCIETGSIVLLCAQRSPQCLDNLICKTENRWHSVDTHFHNGITHMSCSISYEMAASTSYLNNSNKATSTLANMQGQKSLTLHWHTFPGWGWDHVDIVFAPKGSQYRIYTCLWYGGMCSSSRVCTGVCEGVTIVSCNGTCRIHIGSIID
jgi:hypothetical protein